VQKLWCYAFQLDGSSLFYIAFYSSVGLDSGIWAQEKNRLPAGDAPGQNQNPLLVYTFYIDVQNLLNKLVPGGQLCSFGFGVKFESALSPNFGSPYILSAKLAILCPICKFFI